MLRFTCGTTDSIFTVWNHCVKLGKEHVKEDAKVSCGNADNMQ